MFIALSIFTLSSCGPDAREKAAVAYTTEMQALFVENKFITSEFLDVATGLKKKELLAHDVAERFQSRILPRAVRLASEVDAIQPGSEALEQIHGGIERAWSLRADTYTKAAAAWAGNDLDGFARAQADNVAVSLAEERYIKAVNTILAEYQLSLDPYP